MSISDNIASLMDMDWQARVHRSLSNGDFDGALRLAELAIENLRDYPHLVMLANCQRATGNLSQAIATAEEALRKLPPPETPSICCFLLGKLYALAGDLKEATRYLKAALTDHANPDQVLYAIGSLQALMGDLEKAQAIFDRALPIETGNAEYTHTSMIRLLNTGFEATTSRQLPLPRKVTFGGKFTTSLELEGVVLVAGDDVYVRRYLKQVAQSIARYGNHEVGLHVHIVNPSDEAFELCSKVRALGIPFSLSSEIADFSLMPPIFARAFYSLVRFLMLPNVMQMYHVPIVMSDIDQVLHKDPSPYFRAMRRCDGGLVSFPDNSINLLSYFSATLIHVSPSAAGKSFAAQLKRRTLNILMEPEQVRWHVDQAVISSCYLTTKSVKFSDIPLDMLHLAPLPPRDSPADEDIFVSTVASMGSSKSALSDMLNSDEDD
jgi:tetratricopeptide (TPR) repeat protein